MDDEGKKEDNVFELLQLFCDRQISWAELPEVMRMRSYISWLCCHIFEDYQSYMANLPKVRARYTERIKRLSIAEDAIQKQSKLNNGKATYTRHFEERIRGVASSALNIISDINKSIDRKQRRGKGKQKWKRRRISPNPSLSSKERFEEMKQERAIAEMLMKETEMVRLDEIIIRHSAWAESNCSSHVASEISSEQLLFELSQTDPVLVKRIENVKKDAEDRLKGKMFNPPKKQRDAKRLVELLSITTNTI